MDSLRIFGEVNQLDVGISPQLTNILEIIFFIIVYVFFNDNINKKQNNRFLNLIWRAASTGLVASAFFVASYLFREVLMADTKLAEDEQLKNLSYHISFALTSIFLISTSLLWKNLILYQRTKNVVQQWQAFEIILLMSMFFVLFIEGGETRFGLVAGILFIVIYSIILSVNLKWIPYLTIREKWKSLLFLFIIIFSAVGLFFQLADLQPTQDINLVSNLFLMGLFAFVIIYSLSSFLVTLFNLPTSSVFEQKLVEAISFQKLSQSIKPGEDEERVLDILMDSCMSAAYVDAAWMELHLPDDEIKVAHQRFISDEERGNLRKTLLNTDPFGDFLNTNSPSNIEYIYGKLNYEAFASIVIFQLKVHKKRIGNIFLIKEVKEGFNKEMIDIISTFVGQACISVENYRLLNEALRNERYKEELEIAKKVQQSLLPSHLHHNDCFEIHGFSAAADEVGGDYYETYAYNNHQFAMIIGDVSGKGTSAAFNMSQMKGVFHSLVQINLSPKEFLVKANKALSNCLEKKSFITTTYYILDTKAKTIQFARAGHCPTLYFNQKKGGAEFLKITGMGLGMVRNDQYEEFLEEGYIRYEPGDILLMYTDGIIEAKNEIGEEFGYERLKSTLDGCSRNSAENIKEEIIDTVYSFVGKDTLPDDDYSLMVVKFKG
ncbi:GAF domain-containing SpoIIE family protein phosphatase [Pleomorphovibrio marinus]|uniref:GAF domain-containing SpoIIE family protein phosphatase n=1 Tax=Pleomorphovibrio marinus TaxID=2164132 RepID=UPI002937195F|nr:PP2C family protein-serine/threonine phosphatase [Pleomorphovibrio marinus]